MGIRQYVQPLFKIENHMDLVFPTALLLKNDGKGDFYHFLRDRDRETGKTYLERLRDGARAADVPFSGGYIIQTAHFHHPWTHRGYLFLSGSAQMTKTIFTMAVDSWQEGKPGTAFFHLGRVLHLLQDIFVPHHSGLSAVKGHGRLESWLADHWEPYGVERGGYYHWEEVFENHDGQHHTVNSERPYDWIDHGSHLSIDWYDRFFADDRFDEDTFREVAPWIVPNALRFSAGFLDLFFRTVNKLQI